VKFIDRHRFLSSHFEIYYYFFFLGSESVEIHYFPNAFVVVVVVAYNWAWRFVARRRRRKKKKKCKPVKSIDRHRFIYFVLHIWSFVACREPFFPQIFDLFLLHTTLFLEICYEEE